MLTIFCGEDTVASRIQFSKELEKWKSKNAQIIPIESTQIRELAEGSADNLSLFASQTVYTVTNLEKAAFRKSTKNKKDSLYEAIITLSKKKEVMVIDWEEDKPGRNLKLKECATVHESKPHSTIFKLLDLCFPGNKSAFVKTLRSICQTQEEMFVFVMLSRHTRQLMLASEDVLPSNTPPWQKYKIIGQAKKWDAKKLINFYQGLIKIELGTKTSTNPYGIARSLEILACHYL